MESAADPPGGVPGREDTDGDLDLEGADVGLDLVKKRRACAASLLTSVSNSTACRRATPVSSCYHMSSTEEGMRFTPDNSTSSQESMKVKLTHHVPRLRIITLPCTAANFQLTVRMHVSTPSLRMHAMGI